MIAYTVEIKNLPELQNLYRQAPEIASKKIIEAGNKSLLSLQATAKQLSPIDSGRLRQSILVSPMQQSGNTFTGSVGTRACPQFRRITVAARWMAARKLRLVLS